MRRMSSQFWGVSALLALLMTAALYSLMLSPNAYSHRANTPTPSLEERVSALETQVAILQAQVAASPAATTVGATHDVELSLTIEGARNIYFVSGSCYGREGYDDLRIGAAITVTDQAGVIIARGSIDDSDSRGTRCTLFGTIPDVPETAFYQFEVGHREGPSYSLADMQDANWTVDLSIGS